MRARMFLVSSLAVVCLLALPAAGAAQCAPDGDLEFVCGPVNPEDLAAVPDSPWVIVSSMADDGHLYATDSRDHTSRLLFPVDDSAPRHDTALYGACPGPDTSGFRPHGLSLRTGDDNVHTLYVVRHGARESVEVFEIDARGAEPAATWVGCAVAPDGVGLNSVSALPDGGFVATNFQRSTGELWEWQPGADWMEVPGSATAGPNGIEASPDGRWLYIGGWGTQSLIRLSRGQTPVVVDSVDVGFHIDNVHWAPDGTLLAGRPRGKRTRLDLRLSRPGRVRRRHVAGGEDHPRQPREGRDRPLSLERSDHPRHGRHPGRRRDLGRRGRRRRAHRPLPGAVAPPGGTHHDHRPPEVHRLRPRDPRLLDRRRHRPPTWTVNRVTLDVLTDDDGRLYYLSEGSPAYFDAAPIEQAQLDAAALRASGETPPVTEEFVSAVETRDGRTETVYYQLVARSHWGWWSLLPAAVAVILCWLTREPVTSLAAGIVSGALLLGKYDITGEVMIPSLASTNSAGVLLLYLWLLGGLMGVWSRTGAAQGVRRVHDGKVRSRSEERQAGRLGARHRLLPGRDGQHRGGRHHRQADCRQGARQPRGAGLHHRLDRLADRVAARLQRLAGLRAGVHLRLRGRLPRYRGGPHRLLLPERAVLLLCHLRGPGHVPAEHREAGLPGQAAGDGHGARPHDRPARRRRGPIR